MNRKIIGALITGILVSAAIIMSGCVEDGEVTPSTPTPALTSTPTPMPTTPAPTLTPPQFPIKSVQLPRETARFVSGSSTTDTFYERTASGVFIGLHFKRTETKKCEDGFSYTEVTDIIFKGLGGGVPIKKTVIFIYKEEKETIPMDRPYPVFSPMQIVTEYEYENPQEPILSEYQGSTSYVIIENLGKSGNVMPAVKGASIVFHMDKGEKVKVSAHLNELPPYYSGVSGSTEEIRWHAPYRWEVRPALPDDVSQGEIDVERI